MSKTILITGASTGFGRKTTVANAGSQKMRLKPSASHRMRASPKHEEDPNH
jgi:NADP-dependent 3-hydroxy acid dehydrogenase YdfG